MTLYQLTDLQATEPRHLQWRDDHVRVTIADERDSMGFDSVTLTADTVRDLVRFVGDHWGDDESTGGWFTEVIQQIEEVDSQPQTITPDEAPDGYRYARFTDGLSANVWEGIVREGDAGHTSAGLYPFVLPGTARAIAAEFQHYCPTPRDAHASMLDWFDVQPHWDGCPLEFAVTNCPTTPFDRDAYDQSGDLKDPDGWGTGNLMDVPAYADAFPAVVFQTMSGEDIEWLDLGALGFAWMEVTDQS